MSTTLDSLFPGREPVLLDAAMGSALRARGWGRDVPTSLANLDRPELVRRIHEEHRESGARVLTTNTFAALLVRPERCLESVRAGTRLAREAAADGVRVAGSVAAFGLAVDDPQLVDVVAVMVDEGVDVLVFETCNALRDAFQALELRDRLAPRLPAVISISTTDGGHADHGRLRDIVQGVSAADDPQVELGVNCCRGPHEALRLVAAWRPALRWAKPSVGPPGDQVEDDVMAGFARAVTDQQVRYVGGCCGSTASTLLSMRIALGPSA